MLFYAFFTIEKSLPKIFAIDFLFVNQFVKFLLHIL